jgi:hypothetical protein
MDPNDPGQAPDAPPPYGAPPASPYGAPPASPYGEPPPPPYGAPPPTWGVPDSPYGTPPPAWGVPAPAAPAAPARKGPPRRLIAAVIAIIVVVVIAAVGLAVLGGGSGKVLFSASAYNMDSNTCGFDNAITTASTTDSVYVIADLKDTLKAGDSYTITETKNGQAVNSNTLTASKEFTCYIEQGASAGWIQVSTNSPSARTARSRPKGR